MTKAEVLAALKQQWSDADKQEFIAVLAGTPTTNVPPASTNVQMPPATSLTTGEGAWTRSSTGATWELLLDGQPTRVWVQSAEVVNGALYAMQQGNKIKRDPVAKAWTRP